MDPVKRTVLWDNMQRTLLAWVNSSNLEEEGSMFLRNVYKLPPDYTALRHRRQRSSNITFVL
jgi:hypothetical protein